MRLPLYANITQLRDEQQGLKAGIAVLFAP